MFIKAYDVVELEMDKGLVTVRVENGDLVKYPFQFIGIKNTKIKPDQVLAMIVGENRNNAVAIIFPRQKLISQQIYTDTR